MTDQTDVARLCREISAMRKELTKVVGKVDGMAVEMEKVTTDVSKTKDIVEAWQAVKTGGKFLKWVGGVLAALVAIIGAVKLGIAQVAGR